MPANGMHATYRAHGRAAAVVERVLVDEQGNGSNGWRAAEDGSDDRWQLRGVGTVTAPPTRKEAAPKRALASIGFLIDATRRRRSGRLVLWFLVIAMTLGGLGLLLYPIATDIWADRIQNRLEGEFQQASADPETTRSAFQANELGTGDAVTRLRIPKLDVDVIVVEGVSGNALRAGAGHYPDTPLPCEPGNAAIAGHRTGFGEPFRHLDRLAEGDEIIVQTPFGSCTYEVMEPFDGHPNPWVTHAQDWTVVSNTPQTTLTLTTCDPPGTSKNRLILRARLISGTG